MATPDPAVPAPPPENLSGALKRNIDTLAERRRQEAAAASRQEKAAHAITRFAGSMTSAYLHFGVYALWILANLGVFPGLAHFDPSLGILGTEASVEAIFLATFVLISQNQAAEAADRRADLDLHIGLLTEHELTKVATLLTAVAEKLGVDGPAHADLHEVTQHVKPEAVLDHLENQSEGP